MQQATQGFGIRLGRAIDKWRGGGQRAFADAVKRLAHERGVKIPTSYRTLINYLNEDTKPSAAWVDVAAEVLRWNPENLLTGEGPERPGEDPARLTMGVRADAAPRVLALNQLVVNRYGDLPLAARLMVFNYLDDYFGDDLEGWDDGAGKPPRPRVEQVEQLLGRYFAPLLSRPDMAHGPTMALAASLTAAAYVRLATDRMEATNG